MVLRDLFFFETLSIRPLNSNDILTNMYMHNILQ